MVERFFSIPQIEQQQQQQPQILLLSGPPSSGKSSLLFQFAYNSAFSTTSSSAVFLCNRRKLDTCPPFLSQGIDPSSEVFQRIQIKYVDDDEGIKNYFAAFHLQHPTFPLSVIIDDFADFFDERNCQDKYTSPRGRDLAMIRVLALCQNAISRANEAGPCMLLLSDTHHGDSPRLLYIYKRWVSSIYTIKGDGFGSFLLRTSYQSGIAKSAGNRIAKYSIALQYLVLEGIAEDEGQ
ncbi:uncharacterized protein LOC113753097 [Coffea eugenioides]|uniref:Uncharacterized protein n=1 Tax=Coffea arabica TaxID=13443 RepID=A0A6P6VAV4_COFAR|nr:uncharacterized protein LOC113753097 [Coffea eugenioides]